METVHVASFNEVLANLVLMWEKKQPMLLKSILLQNQKLGGIIENGTLCKKRVAEIMEPHKKSNKKGVLHRICEKTPTRKRVHPYGGRKRAQKG